MSRSTVTQMPAQVVVVGQRFAKPYPMTMVITKKVLSRGELTVTDVSGNLIFKVKGSFFSAADRHVLKNAAGIPMLTLR